MRQLASASMIRKEALRRMQESIGLLRHRSLAMCFRRLQSARSPRGRDELGVQSHDRARAFQLWKLTCEARLASLLRVAVALRRWCWVAYSQCFCRWRSQAAGLSVVRDAAVHWSRQSEARAVRQLASASVIQKEALRRMQESIGLLRHRSLAMCFLRLQEDHVLARRVGAAAYRHGVARVLRLWRSTARARLASLSRVAVALRRWCWVEYSHCFCRWRWAAAGLSAVCRAAVHWSRQSEASVVRQLAAASSVRLEQLRRLQDSVLALQRRSMLVLYYFRQLSSARPVQRRLQLSAPRLSHGPEQRALRLWAHLCSVEGRYHRLPEVLPPIRSELAVSVSVSHWRRTAAHGRVLRGAAAHLWRQSTLHFFTLFVEAASTQSIQMRRMHECRSERERFLVWASIKRLSVARTRMRIMYALAWRISIRMQTKLISVWVAKSRRRALCKSQLNAASNWAEESVHSRCIAQWRLSAGASSAACVAVVHWCSQAKAWALRQLATMASSSLIQLCRLYQGLALFRQHSIAACFYRLRTMRFPQNRTRAFHRPAARAVQVWVRVAQAQRCRLALCATALGPWRSSACGRIILEWRAATAGRARVQRAASLWRHKSEARGLQRLKSSRLPSQRLVRQAFAIALQRSIRGAFIRLRPTLTLQSMRFLFQRRGLRRRIATVLKAFSRQRPRRMHLRAVAHAALHSGVASLRDRIRKWAASTQKRSALNILRSRGWSLGPLGRGFRRLDSAYKRRITWLALCWSADSNCEFLGFLGLTAMLKQWFATVSALRLKRVQICALLRLFCIEPFESVHAFDLDRLRMQLSLAFVAKRRLASGLCSWRRVHRQQARLSAKLSHEIRRVEASGIRDGVSVRLARQGVSVRLARFGGLLHPVVDLDSDRLERVVEWFLETAERQAFLRWTAATERQLCIATMIRQAVRKYFQVVMVRGISDWAIAARRLSAVQLAVISTLQNATRHAFNLLMSTALARMAKVQLLVRFTATIKHVHTAACFRKLTSLASQKEHLQVARTQLQQVLLTRAWASWATANQLQAALTAELSVALQRVEASGIRDGVSVRISPVKPSRSEALGTTLTDS